MLLRQPGNILCCQIRQTEAKSCFHIDLSFVNRQELEYLAQSRRVIHETRAEANDISIPEFEYWVDNRLPNAGVTRQDLMRLVRIAKAWSEEEIRLDKLQESDECFL